MKAPADGISRLFEQSTSKTPLFKTRDLDLKQVGLPTSSNRAAFAAVVFWSMNYNYADSEPPSHHHGLNGWL
jgi:hypothetical protein